MSYEIVSQVENPFKNKEQWNNFLDIADKRIQIRDTWWRKFQSEMNKSVSSVKNWGFSSVDHLNYRCYINGFTRDSVCLVAGNFNNRISIGLWAPQYKYDLKKLSELLQEEKIGEPIKAKFDCLHYNNMYESSEWKYAEYIILDDVKEDDPLHIERMAWYANYETAELVSLFNKKINKFREDEEITRILTDLNNNETIIKKQ